VFPAVAVEQANPVAGVKSEDHGQMMRLGPLQIHGARPQLTVDVESLRHACYTPFGTRPRTSGLRLDARLVSLKRSDSCRAILLSTTPFPQCRFHPWIQTIPRHCWRSWMPCSNG